MVTEAYAEWRRIRHMTAFNPSPRAKRRRVNQHVTLYTFPDASELRLYADGRGTVTERGVCVVIGAYRATARGGR